jgi:tRNA A37 threonylcarbamoyladenosine dehydratase
MQFEHEVAFRGDDDVQRLGKAKVAICGCGALGSNLAVSLVKQGVKSIRLIDFDRVTEGNTALQHYGLQDVGTLKVQALSASIFDDLGAIVEISHSKITESNAKKELRDCKIVVDCFDNTQSRSILKAFGDHNRVPVIHAGVVGGYGEVVHNAVYKVPEETGAADVCDYPLARNLVTLTVSVLSEEVVRMILGKPPRSVSITLEDLAIRPYLG